jgi:hypothetical protein
LDAKVDRPWMRSGFRHGDLHGWAKEHRGELIWAALTLVQAWLAAGRPPGGAALGSFENWAATLGGILSVAGVPGFLANLRDLYEKSDEDTGEWQAFLELWWERHKDHPLKTQDLFLLATEAELLDSVLGDKNERSQKTRLGRALGKKRDRVIGEYRIEAGGRDHKTRNVFRLQRADAKPYADRRGTTMELFSTSPTSTPTLGVQSSNVGTTSAPTSAHSTNENHIANGASADVADVSRGSSLYITHARTRVTRVRALRSSETSATSAVDEKAQQEQQVNPADVGADVANPTSAVLSNVGGRINTNTHDNEKNENNGKNDDWEVFEI